MKKILTVILAVVILTVFAVTPVLAAESAETTAEQVVTAPATMDYVITASALALASFLAIVFIKCGKLLARKK